jgi:CubicO group peptidase (beta-lactamase class C family)
MKLSTDRIDTLFAEWDTPDSPGCALAIIHDGSIIYKRGYGMADLESNTPITSQSVFNVASTSKQFTAASIVLLAQQGRLSLDDDIRTYVPEIPQSAWPITIRHLIHHISGLRDYLELKALAGMIKEGFRNDDVIEILSRQRGLNFTPGEQHLYSNSGYIVLAEIVRRVSGKSLREFAEESIFGPLRMHDTHFDDGSTMDIRNRVISYGHREGGGFEGESQNVYVVGDGGLLTTVEDLYCWDQNFYDNRLGGRQFVDQLMTLGKLNNGEELDYAYGLFLGEYKGLKKVSHGGSYGGFRSQMIRFPYQKFTVVCLANLSTLNPDRLIWQIVDLCLVDQFQLDEFVGQYQNEDLRVTYNLIVEEGNLFFKHQYAPKEPLESISSDTFRVKNMDIVFTRNEQRQITGFLLNTGRAKHLHFIRVESP